MSTTQIICKTEMWQPEPTKSLVESIPVKDGVKLSMNNSWEDLRGLSWTFYDE